MKKENACVLATLAIGFAIAALILVSLAYSSLEILSGVDISDNYFNIVIGNEVTYCFHSIAFCIAV